MRIEGLDKIMLNNIYIKRLLSLLTGLKYHALILASIGLLMGVLPGSCYVAIIGIIIGGRVITDISYKNVPTEEGTSDKEI